MRWIAFFLVLESELIIEIGAILLVSHLGLSELLQIKSCCSSHCEGSATSVEALAPPDFVTRKTQLLG